MSEDPDSYRPKSPDLSGFVPPPHLGRIPSYQTPTDSTFPPGYSFSPRGSYDASPYFSPQNSQPSHYFGAQPHSQPLHNFSPKFTRTPSIPTIPSQLSQQHSPSQSQRPLPPTFSNLSSHSQFLQHDPYCASPTAEMPRTRARRNVDDHDTDYDPNNAAPSRTAESFPLQPQQPQAPDVDPALTIDVRTKFPVARIKRIMQADEDVGKVAQATPTAVAKALELFMISLILRASNTAKTQSSKRITAQHLKASLTDDKQFDFLMDCCADVPDEDRGGAGGAAGRSHLKSEGDEDSDDDMDGDAGGGVAPKKRRKSKPAKRKKEESSEETD